MRLFLFAAALVIIPFAHAQADAWQSGERNPGKVAVISARQNEEAWYVPGGKGDDGRPALLKARVFRPPGEGPFKVAIVSHGSPPSSSGRPTMEVPRYASPSLWLVQRGYLVVMPLRRGYGGNGEWKEDYGNCRGADFVAAGNGTADDIEPVARYFGTLPVTQAGRILLVGVSAGGFGSVAAAHRNIEGVFGLLNFSGGRGGHQGRYGDENCSPGNLVKAAAIFGNGVKVPSLWIYSENDSFFGPDLARRMVEAYRAGGARIEFLMLPPFKRDGHAIFSDADARPLWADRVDRFLKTIE